MYTELFVPVDNSPHSGWAIERAAEICRLSGGCITGSHVYAARLHDVRFRQLETGLPAQFQAPEELKRQRKVHDKLIEKGLQLISDSFLDRVEAQCADAGVPLRRQLLEGTNFEEIIKEANRGEGTLPSLIGFDLGIAAHYDGGEHVREDVRLGDVGRIEGESAGDELAGRTGRVYDLVVMGAHGIGRQPRSQLGSVVARSARGIERDLLVVRDASPLLGGRFLVCVDGSAYSYRAMEVALELAARVGARVFVASAFDVEFHHAVFDNIKGVLSERASKVFKFEEQEELHNNIIDRGLLKLCQANLERAVVIAERHPEVAVETQVLIGKPFQAILRWIDEIEPTLLVLGRHGSHRIDGTALGSQADDLMRLAPCNVLVTGVEGIQPQDVPWIEHDGAQGLEWAPEAMARIQRAPPFAQGIARRAVEEHVAERGAELVTNERLDEAIAELLPTHMQIIMGIGDEAEVARAEVKAEEQMARTLVLGSESDAEPAGRLIEIRCPVTGRVTTRERGVADPCVWTVEAFDRLKVVPLLARPLARRTVERFAVAHELWRITTAVMDENRQAMIEAEEFDAETMTGMFREMRAQQIRAGAQSAPGAHSGGMRPFVEETKVSGASRCPIRDVEKRMSQCPIDFETVPSAEAKAAAERMLAEERARGGED